MSVLPLADGPPAPVEVIGGKASGLGELFRLGLPVPPAVVLTADAHDRWREAGRLADADRRALAAALGSLGEPLAVRSSAVDEDRDGRSAAGQYDSVMGVRGLDAAIAAVEHCWREADGGRSETYRGGGTARVALVVQREAPADRAGIAFSVDPVSGASDCVLVEAVFGHGEGAVGGTITPDRYRVDRTTSAVSARLADKAATADGGGRLSPLPPNRRLARTLRDDEAQAVAAIVLEAESGLGRPVDVEFCFAHGVLWAVQCRPITSVTADA